MTLKTSDFKNPCLRRFSRPGVSKAWLSGLDVALRKVKSGSRDDGKISFVNLVFYVCWPQLVTVPEIRLALDGF